MFASGLFGQSIPHTRTRRRKKKTVRTQYRREPWEDATDAAKAIGIKRGGIVVVVIEGFWDWFFAVAIGFFALVGVATSISYASFCWDMRDVKF